MLFYNLLICGGLLICTFGNCIFPRGDHVWLYNWIIIIVDYGLPTVMLFLSLFGVSFCGYLLLIMLVNYVC